MNILSGLSAARMLPLSIKITLNAFVGQYAADLCLFAEGEYVGLNTMVLPGPHLAGNAHSALYFVKYQEDLIFIAYVPQLLEELSPKVIISAFALDGFNDDRTNIIGSILNGVLYLVYGFLLGLFNLFKMLFQRPNYLRVGNPWPIVEFGEVLIFLRVSSIGERKGITAAPMEGFFKVYYLGTLFSAFGITSCDILSNLPVHCHL
jgi:hypothetical protein